MRHSRKLLAAAAAAVLLALASATPPVQAQTLRSLSVDELGTLGTLATARHAEAAPAALTRSSQPAIPAAQDTVPGHFVVLYADPAAADHAAAHAAASGTRLLHASHRFGLATFAAEAGDDAAPARMRALPGVLAVLQDRVVRAHALSVRPALTHADDDGLVHNHHVLITGPRTEQTTTAGPDAAFNSPAGWAVRAVGGYGAGIPGGPAVGPWNRGFGAGVRIAILDSGIDRTHPDLAPNLALNLSEIDTAALPSPCDDGASQDQQGHGTWVASLAAGALGGGAVVGVAPQATLLNIKVLERLPATTGATLTARCSAGEAGGLLSWVLVGIDDAVANHADIISVSLGSLVDLTTGDGAGWKVAFDRATHAAFNAGTLVVAAVGNDTVNLSQTLIELPAQARDVVAVVASTNPDCAENLAPAATCAAAPTSRASYSNFAATGAIAAPGGNLPNTTAAVSGYIRGACTTGNSATADGAPVDVNHSFSCFAAGRTPYVDAIGTSASAPLAAGAAALLKSAHPTWTAADLAAHLRAAPPAGTMTEPFARAD